MSNAPTRADSGLAARSLIALLAAAFAVGVGYGVVLPFLPAVLERLGEPSTGGAIQRTTGWLTGAYTAGPVLLAPLWGALSDRIGRRPVLLVGLAGFAVTLGLSAVAPSLTWLYAARLSNGAFAAAVIPVVLAILADHAPDEAWRARRFSWVGIASIAGLLAGPMVGVLSALVAQTQSRSGLAAPLMIATAFAVVATIFTAMFQPKTAPNPRSAIAVEPLAAPPRWLFNGLMLLTGASSAAVGSFHVGLALQGRASAMTPPAISLMFAECSLVMLFAQLVVFSRWVPQDSTRRLLVPALLLLAASFLLISGLVARAPLRAAVDLFAASAGVLTPILLFWISRTAGEAQGRQMGRQTAVASLGQTIGSVATGLFLASSLWSGLGFTIMAVVLIVAGLAALPIVRGLKAIGAANRNAGGRSLPS